VLPGLPSLHTIRFLLARLHVDSLLDKRTKRKVLSTLGSFSEDPKPLEQAYKKAIERIDAQRLDDRALARSALSWITYAHRPLSTTELCQALAISPGDLELDADNVPDVEEVITVCAGLLTVDPESKFVRLVHYTTQEYLRGIRETWIPAAQEELALRCMTYLSFASLHTSLSFRDPMKIFRKNAFLNYAGQYWADHVLPVQEELLDFSASFFGDLETVKFTSQVRELIREGYAGYNESFSPLHLTAAFDLVYFYKAILSNLSEEALVAANAKDYYGQTPLSIAAEEGSTEIARCLLDFGADANSKDYHNRAPLWYAARGGHADIVETLLARNAHADPKDDQDRTPFSIAAEAGQEAVMRLLLWRDDVDIDSRDRELRTPLHFAISRGQEEAVRLLLNHDKLDVNAVDTFGWNALSYAVTECSMYAVRLLLRRVDLDMNSIDPNNNSDDTPLSRAKHQSFEEIVVLLEEKIGSKSNVHSDTSLEFSIFPSI
jgi:ankyrin repeat protein